MREEAAAELRAVNEVVERLRAPGGCPWDSVQTHATLRPYLLEEAYEVLEAIEAGVPERLREELGDLLLQVLLHSAIAAESEGFDIGDVSRVTREKLVHRHPHVFGDTEVSGPAEVVVNWEKLKSQEKKDRISVLDGVPRTLPALAYALGVQKRPARLGFDATPGLDDAIGGLREAVDVAAQLAGGLSPPARGEDWVRDAAPVEDGDGPAGAEPRATTDVAPPVAGHAAPPPAPAPELEDAVGGVLFAVVALARRLRVDPEDALRRRAADFADRFRRLEFAARRDGVDLHDADHEDWAARWAAVGGDRHD